MDDQVARARHFDFSPTYPFDLGEDGVNRPGLHLHPTYHAVRESGTGVA
ncbi:hypothetical protein [Nonomuraea recticatena]